MIDMKLWIDDVRPAPNGYYWCKRVKEAINIINYSRGNSDIELIDIDHDAGDYAEFYGGDYINVLNWMEANGVNNIPIHIHTMNVVGRMNMEAICRRNGWTIVK